MYTRFIPSWTSAALWLPLLALFMVSAAHASEASRVAKPNIVIEKGDKCVAPAEVMRREHMNMLKHHRDETMHKGIRTTQYSLKKCVDCHASSKNGSVVGSRDNFCQTCHAYAAVKLDCFECHSTKPESNAKAPTGAVKSEASESKQ